MHIHQIPIINYHKIDPLQDIGVTSRRPDMFRSDMQIILNLNYTPITFKDLHQNINIPEKPVIITFDDGYESVYTYAFPVMKEFGFKGVIFMPTDYIGKYNDWDVQFGNKKFKHLTKDQLIQLHDYGFEIGSHAISHQLLTMMPDAKLIVELRDSKQYLQDILDEKIISISYPFGRFTKRTLRISNQTGYEFGTGSIYYRSVPASFSHLALKRFNIYQFDSQKVFIQKLGGHKMSLLSLRDWLIQKGGIATIGYQYIRDLFKD